MSTRRRQLQRISDEVIQGELTDGQYPFAITLREKINAYFKERPLGTPRYAFARITENAVSDPDAYNKDMKDIKEDLETSFEGASEQVDRLMNMSDRYETEKRGLELSLQSLEDRMDVLLNRLSYDYDVRSIFNTFNNFNDIDFIGDTRRGIPKTNSFIDLKLKQAMLEQVDTRVEKEDLSEKSYAISIVAGSQKGRELSPFPNALKDTINESWEYIVESDKVEETTVQVDIDLGKVVSATSLSLELNSPKSTDARLLVSEDGQVYHELISQISSQHIEWQMDHLYQHVRLLFTKKEADYTTGVSYEYYFGVGNISLKREMFLKEGYVVSEPYPFPEKQVSRVTLKVDDIIYPHTSIRYYVAIDREDELIEWQQLKDNESIDLLKLHHEEMIISNLTLGYGESIAIHHGVNYHNVANLMHNPEEYRLNMRMGHYAWKVEAIPPNPRNQLQDDKEPSLSDWRDAWAIETSYLPIEETYGGSQYELRAKHKEKFSTWAYSEEGANIFNNEFIHTNAKVRVYLNDVELRPIVHNDQNFYNYALKEGWNKIEFLTKNLGSGIFYPNLYLKDVIPDEVIYADRTRLQQVDIYDLFNNTSARDFSRFAVHEGKIIVNYDPKAIDLTGRGIKYQVEYPYISQYERDYSHIRFMAVLSRSDRNSGITPVLRNYQIITE